MKGLQATFSAGLLPDKRCNKHRAPKKKKGVETGERETNVTKLKNEKALTSKMTSFKPKPLEVHQLKVFCRLIEQPSFQPQLTQTVTRLCQKMFSVRAAAIAIAIPSKVEYGIN